MSTWKKADMAPTVQKLRTLTEQLATFAEERTKADKAKIEKLVEFAKSEVKHANPEVDKLQPK